MGSIEAVFDTNILIDLLNGRSEARDEIHRYLVRAISIVTWIEVRAGVNSITEERTNVLLDRFVVLELTRAVASRAAEIRRERRLKLPDAIILATAEIEGCMLVTRNTRDFAPGRPGTRVPYQI